MAAVLSPLDPPHRGGGMLMGHWERQSKRKIYPPPRTCGGGDDGWGKEVV
jgi:hypothetical protein